MDSTRGRCGRLRAGALLAVAACGLVAADGLRAEEKPDPPPVKLGPEACGDACALLTLFAYDDLVANACKRCERYDDTFCTVDFPFSDVPSCDAYDELRNCIYARYGYVFTSPRWKERFGKEPWYRPDPGFTEARLPAVARANVERLKELKAKKQGCQ